MWAGGVRVAILDSENRLLMLRQRHEDRDVWMLPGGTIEEQENSEQAAVREVKEETGLDVRIKALLWHVEEVSEKRGQRFVIFFLAEITGGELILGTDPERKEGEQVMQETRFMHREEVEALEHLYPEYLKDELWDAISESVNGLGTFKVRKHQLK
ncbi:MAG: NUDIX hydrolase [Clostridiales bacterium]|nr:NUDIX hydrolase [Clostridiales bacterium]